METRIIGSFPGHRAYLLLQIILLIMVINPTFGQTFTTPETFSHKKEVFRPVSYYTGQVDVSIPLLEIKTNEMSIPVLLKYIGGEGLRAINPYGNVGFGWKLSAGGVITRTVNGLPDETIYSSNSKGFFLRDPNNGIKNETVRNNAYLFLDNYFKADSVEYSPDIFSFNFLGYSGYFVMGYDGIFRIQSQDIVNAEVFTTSFPTIGNVICFKLTSNDGTVFTFGSKEGSIELSGGELSQPFQLHAWYLTRIDFINGRFIDFNYEPNKDIYLHYLPSVWGGGGRLTVSSVVPANIIFPGGKAIFFSDLKPHSICNCIDDLRIINKIELQTPSNQKNHSGQP